MILDDFGPALLQDGPLGLPVGHAGSVDSRPRSQEPRKSLATSPESALGGGQEFCQLGVWDLKKVFSIFHLLGYKVLRGRVADKVVAKEVSGKLTSS